MARRDVIVVGASAGGLQALQDLLRSLPNDLDAAILIAIHSQRKRGKDFLLEIGQRYSRMETIPIVNGQIISSQHIYVAPPEGHVQVRSGLIEVIAGEDKKTRESTDHQCSENLWRRCDWNPAERHDARRGGVVGKFANEAV